MAWREIAACPRQAGVSLNRFCDDLNLLDNDLTNYCVFGIVETNHG